MAGDYRVNITDGALADLTALFDYVRQDSPQNATEVIERLLAAIDGLEDMPSRFRVAGQSRKYGSVVHARVERPFIIYYRVDEPSRSVFVLQVLRGARRQPRRFE